MGSDHQGCRRHGSFFTQTSPCACARACVRLIHRCCAAQVYEGLEYKLSLSFTAEYPFSAPTVKFVTPCFHPNVDQHGNICLDILKVCGCFRPDRRRVLSKMQCNPTRALCHSQENWTAAYSVQTILVSLQSLLGGETDTRLLS